MKIYAITVLLERLDTKKPERILLHRSRFRADHDFHAIDVARDLDLITKRSRRSFAQSLYEWFAKNPQAADDPGKDDGNDELGM